MTINRTEITSQAVRVKEIEMVFLQLRDQVERSEVISKQFAEAIIKIVVPCTPVLAKQLSEPVGPSQSTQMGIELDTLVTTLKYSNDILQSLLNRIEL